MKDMKCRTCVNAIVQWDDDKMEYLYVCGLGSEAFMECRVKGTHNYYAPDDDE